jgi:D-serine deaminase-like pyridoxal phosphate-dependent protein
VNAETTIDWRAKGFPPSAQGLHTDDFARSRPSLFEAGFSWPVMVIRRSAVDHNVAMLADYCTDRGVSLAPHVKTTMSPQLWERQLAAGAWGLTVATPHQARVVRAHGVRRIFLANELVDATAVAWAVDEMARDDGFELTCYVDSVTGAEILGEVTRGRGGRRLRVVLELGHEGGRTGCRTDADAMAVARAVQRESSLALVGVAGYEGGLGHDRSAATVEAVHSFVQRMRDMLVACDAEHLLDADTGEYVVSCGGSAFFDLVTAGLTGAWDTRLPVRVLLRSGAYVTHDSLFYERLSPLAEAPANSRLRSAIEVWGQVLSRPEPRLALVGIGKRDIAFDEGMPVVLATRSRAGTDAIRALEGCTVDRLNDQHAYLSVPGSSDLAVGDLVCLGISHPCTAHDKWQLVPLVDDDHRVVETARSYF